VAYNQRFLVVIKLAAKCVHVYENINRYLLKEGKTLEGC